MAIDKVKRSFVWLRKVMRITEKTTLPGEILGDIRPILDTFGWDLLTRTERLRAVSPGVTFNVLLPTVPEDEAHLVIACDVFHNEGAAKDLTILYRNRGGLDVALTNTGGTGQFFHRVLERPFLVNAGERLIGNSRNSINGGFDFTISALFIRLDLGEYVPGSPYG